MERSPPTGMQLVRRPLWPVALESLLLRELLHLWDTGSGELLIDSAWVSNFRLRSLSAERLAPVVDLPGAEVTTFAGYLRGFLSLGGAVRLMFREDGRNRGAAEGGRALARELASAPAELNTDTTWRLPGPPLQVRTHQRGHSKRLLGVLAGYVGSANLTANGLFHDRDDTVIYWGEEALLPFVNAFLSDWDAAEPLQLERAEP